MNITFEKRSFIYFLKLLIFFGAVVLVWSEASRQFVFYVKRDLPSAPLEEPIQIEARTPIEKAEVQGIRFTGINEVMETKDAFVAEKRSFIFADFMEKIVAIYREGRLVKTFPILSLPETGSFFEIPSGQFRVEARKKDHVSRLANISMPWSILFDGNYVIHGVPSQTSSSEKPDAMSTGGVRLAYTDARELFSFAKDGMDILVLASDNLVISHFDYFKKENLIADIKKIGISSASLLVADVENGEMLLEKDIRGVRPIASVTKLMTALVALDEIPRLKPLAVSKTVLDTYGNSGRLVEGEVMKVEDFIYPLILSSSNDVAVIFEQSVQNFIDIMNKKAEKIGMLHTTFRDSSGLSQFNVSTAEDLLKLLQYIYKNNEPLFWLTGLKEYTVLSGKAKHVWTNVNWPREDNRYMGGKMGFTSEAFQTMAGVYKVRMSEYGERPIAIIVLGSQDRIKDIATVIGYLEKNFIYGGVLVRSKNPPEKSQSGIKPPIIGRAGANIYEAISGIK